MPTVSIVGQSITYEVKENEIIFDALERQGNELSHGCLAGSCGACRIEIIKGNENLATPSPIELNTIQAIITNMERISGKGSMDGRIVRLACRAKINGDVQFKELS